MRARHFPLIDSLRALAFCSVLATHTAYFAGLEREGVALRPFFARLDAGLYIFFLVSGFLLYRPFAAARLAGEPVPLLRAYAWRRFLRIAPAYWLALTAIGLWFGLSTLFELRHLPFYYGFAHIYNSDTLGLQPIPQAWTLCVEASFYLLLPLYALAIRRLPARAARAPLAGELGGAALLIACGILYTVAVGPPKESLGAPGAIASLPAHLVLPGYVDYFGLGMALAVLSVWYEERPLPASLRVLDRLPSLAWGAALAAFLVASTAIGLTGSVLDRMSAGTYLARHCLYALVALGVMLPAVFGDPRRGLVRRMLASRALRYVGMVSYVAYLFEFAVLDQLDLWDFGSLARDTSPYMWFPAALAGALLIATLSWYGFERPILRLRRLVPARPPVDPEATLEAVPRPAPATLGSAGR